MVASTAWRFWLPAGATSICAMAALRMQMVLGIEPAMPFGWGGHVWVFYLPWLGVLPLVGALGSWLSRRAGGSAGERQLAGMAPVLALATLMVLLLVPELIFDTPRHGVMGTVYGVVWYSVCWLLVPGSALGLGVLGSMVVWPQATIQRQHRET